MQCGEPELLKGVGLADILGQSDQSLIYLSSVDTQLANGGVASQLSIYTVSAILISTLSTRVQLAAINTIREIVTRQPTQVSGLIFCIASSCLLTVVALLLVRQLL